MSKKQILLAWAIRDNFPRLPVQLQSKIATFACRSGRVGNIDLLSDGERARRSVVAYIRHTMTNYDRLLTDFAYTRDQARDAVRAEIADLVAKFSR